MKTYELAIAQEDGLTHAQMIPLTGGRYVLAEEARAEIERLRVVVEKRGLPIDVFNDCERLTADNERLREVLRCAWHLRRVNKELQALLAAYDRQKAEIERLREDAERWRKLEQEVDYLHIYVVPSTGDAYANVEALRKAIDAARRE